MLSFVVACVLFGPLSIHCLTPHPPKVDRVLAERNISSRRSGRTEGEGGGLSGLEYLACWKELPLDQASWEAAEVGVGRGGWLCGSGWW